MKKKTGCQVSGNPDTLEIIYQDLLALAADMVGTMDNAIDENIVVNYDEQLDAIFERREKLE